MKIIALVFVFLSLASSLVIGEGSAQQHDNIAANLKGFPQVIGGSFGDEKVGSLLNFINAASTIYRDDLEKNMKYIQANMQAAFGNDNYTFNVLIQSNSTPSITDRHVFNVQGDTYASLAPGVNLINPTWSYFVYILQKLDGRPFSLEYIPQIGQSR
jgi:hypothetical protein